MQADVSTHESVDQGDEGNLGVGSVSEAAAERQEERGVARVDSGVGQSHDLVSCGEFPQILSEEATYGEEFPETVADEHLAAEHVAYSLLYLRERRR